MKRPGEGGPKRHFNVLFQVGSVSLSRLVQCCFTVKEVMSASQQSKEPADVGAYTCAPSPRIQQPKDALPRSFNNLQEALFLAFFIPVETEQTKIQVKNFQMFTVSLFSMT